MAYGRFHLDDAVQVTRRRGWVAGWVSVTRRYCIKTAKPILKNFQPSGSPIILVSSDPAPIPNSKENPFSRGGKIGDFRAIFGGNRRAVYLGNGARYRPMELWNYDNRKSWVPD